MGFDQPDQPERDLSRSEVESLKEDGVIRAPKVLSDSWVQRIATGIEHTQKSPSKLGEALSIKDNGFTSDLFMSLNND